jgi:uncharacterized protein
MTNVGKVESVWRYPVKSMRGHAMKEAFVGYGGLLGDRLYAFGSAKSPAGFPYVTGREIRQMVTWEPRFVRPERSVLPPNLAEARALDPDLTPAPTAPGDMALEVVLPDGRVLAIDDPALAAELGSDGPPMRSEKAIADCRPVSLFSLQTAARLGEELGRAVDQRRFRANFYLDMSGTQGFAEDALAGKAVRIGDAVTIHVIDRDPRCAMITLDPDTGERDFAVLKNVTEHHEGFAGVYGAVLTEGVVRPGDAVTVIDGA